MSIGEQYDEAMNSSGESGSPEVEQAFTAGDVPEDVIDHVAREAAGEMLREAHDEDIDAEEIEAVAHAGAEAVHAHIGDVGAPTDMSVEGLVADLERVTGERDQYLETSRRIQAEFENYRKQVGKREAEARERANEGLVSEMLPVLDAFDGAIGSGVEDVAPMRTTLLDALAKHGLERIDPGDAPFDPNLHEAVMHEEGDGSGPVVAEVMRAGYSWRGRVIRPAMVRVKG